MNKGSNDKRYFLLGLSIIMLLLLVSCGEGGFDLDGDEQPQVFQQTLSTQGVKLISASITDPRNEATMQQKSYTLDENARLLLRLEKLNEVSGDVVIDDENRMVFKLTLQDENTAIESLELCPLERDWMMLATWIYAHPFPGGNGRWGVAGGDFEESECLEGVKVEEIVSFDVSEWYQYYIQSLGQNFGWVLLSRQRITFYGDGHGRFAPKLVWKKR